MGQGLLQGRDPVGMAINWRRLGGLAEIDRGRFDEEILGGWIRVEKVEAFSKDPFESVKAPIIISCEGKVMDLTEVAGDDIGVMESSE